MLHSLIQLPLWVRALAAIAGFTVAVPAFLGYLGGQPTEVIAIMVGVTLFAISQFADLRPDAGHGPSARILRRSTQILVAILVGGWVFVVAGLIYLYVRRGTIWFEP